MAAPAVHGARRVARRAPGGNAPRHRSFGTGTPRVRPLLALALLCALAAALPWAPRTTHAAPPPAGAVVRNQASAATAAGGIVSNELRAPVQAPRFDLHTHAGPVRIYPGEQATFGLDAFNLGDGTAGPVPVTVDGAPASGVVASMPVPAGITFGFPLAAPVGTRLYHLAGSPPGEYVTALPADPSRVDGVALLVGNLPAGGGLTFSWAGYVNPGTAGTVVAPGSLLYASGSSIVTAPAAAASIEVLVPATGGLFLEKAGDRNVVEVGETLRYTLSVGNRSGVLLPAVTVADDLPAGFRYRAGSARLDGAPLADPAGSPGPRLVFSVGDLPAGATASLTYDVAVGAGSLEGDGVNRARAASDDLSVSSNGASFKVRVLPGPFTDRGYIAGKVFTDCDGDGVQGPGEGGIPGVRIFLEDGTYAVTDREGRYSFYGVVNRNHVLKVDGATLPAGARMVPLSSRNGGSGTTRFVDLWGGELHRADFAEGSCSAAVKEEAAARRSRLDASLGADGAGLDGRLPATPSGNEPPPGQGVAASSPPAGPPAAAPPAAPPVAPAPHPAYPPAERPEGGAPSPPPPPPSLDLGASLSSIEGKGLAFLAPRDGELLPVRQANVVVKGVAGATLRLLVNGREIPSSRVGRRTVHSGKGTEGWEYVGVDLLPGENELRLVQADPFGNPRGETAIRVTAPGDLARVAVELPGSPVPADGSSRVAVRVRLLDAAGRPVAVRTPVTLEASAGEWKARDLDPREPGLQLFVEGGAAEVPLAAPADAGDVAIRATSGALAGEGSAWFSPDLRPMVASGIVEGMVGLRDLDLRSLTPAREQDGFQRELRAFSFGDGDKAYGGARAAFYLKGKVRGDALLTMAYDSDKETKERLFRDIQPDEYYPVYGDGSARGFDAQSSSRFFVRVDKGRSFATYGDYVTMAPSAARNLGAYQRTLTGAKGHYEDSRVSVTAFASEDTAAQAVDEIPGAGVSGPYALSRGDVVENSERVEILVRDRNQPSRVLKRTPQSRFTDYEIDHLAGRLLFKAPVPSVDADLNPVSIRVLYESDQGGERFWTAGGEGRVRLSRNLELGGTAATDRNPVEKYTLGSVNAVALLRDNAVLVAEAARSEDDLLGTGEAKRVELRRDGAEWGFRAYAEEADRDFRNPSSTVVAGERNLGAKGHVRLVPQTVVRVEALRTEEVGGGGRRDHASLSVEQPVTRHLLAQASVRHDRDEGFDNTATAAPGGRVDAAKLRLSGQLPTLTALSLFGEYEQSLHDAGKVLAGGGEYRVGSWGRVYGRHEFVSELAADGNTVSGGRDRALTVIGADSRYMKDGSVFSEYRVRDLATGRELESAVGLRNGFDMGRGVRLSTTLENIRKEGAEVDTATAATAGVDYSGDNAFKASTRLEFRTDEGSDAWLHTAGAARRLTPDWTALARYAFDFTDNRDGRGDAWHGRARAGLALRPAGGSPWNALWLYEYRYERDEATADGAPRRIVHVLSTHGNWSPRPALALSGRYAGKAVSEEAGHALVQLAEGRLTVDLSRKWDAGVAAGAMWDDAFRAVRYRTGAEVGYQLFESLWLSGGVNVTGFSDRDMTAGDYTAKGCYLRMRFKFDEGLVPAFVRGDDGAAAPSDAGEGKR